MALVVETGAGLSTADSYISLTDANTYVAAHGADTAWGLASDGNKEKALQLATQYIDLEYGMQFKGIRALGTQALCWPRYNVYDDDNYYVASDDVPRQIEHATVEAALRVIAGDTLLETQSNPGSIKSESKTIGPMSKSIEYMGGKPASGVKVYPKIRALLLPLLESSTLMERG
jgi:hypothetical protein